MRRIIPALLAAVMASPLLAASGGGVIVFTAPDGSRRVANVAPVLETATVPAGSMDRRKVLWPVVERVARANGLDPDLVDLVIRMESGYDPRAVSRKGATGVMQLMPETARMYGVSNLFDPHENIRGGVSYLRDLMSRFQADLSLALAAYNAGPEAVARYGGVPPYEETQSYVRTILGAYSGQPTTRLRGGFGVHQPSSRPVTVSSSGDGAFISNRPAAGDAPLVRRLSLR